MKKRFVIAVCTVAILVLVSACSTGKQPGARISISAERDHVIELLEKDVGRISPLKPFLRLLPEKFAIDFTVIYTGEEENCIKLDDVTVNGKPIPEEVLRNISENYLDFNCSLVYN